MRRHGALPTDWREFARSIVPLGNDVPLMVALGVGGLIAGVIAVRTRSLLPPHDDTSGGAGPRPTLSVVRTR